MVLKTESFAQMEGISSVFITVVFFKTDLPLTTAPHAPTLKGQGGFSSSQGRLVTLVSLTEFAGGDSAYSDVRTNEKE